MRRQIAGFYRVTWQELLVQTELEQQHNFVAKTQGPEIETQ
jgi:hypothetical protein